MTEPLDFSEIPLQRAIFQLLLPQTSIEQAIAEKLSALMTENYLKDRARRGNRAKYEAILAKVPDVEPEEYDRIPTV